MAWYDRLTNAVRRIADRLAGTGGPQPGDFGFPPERQPPTDDYGDYIDYGEEPEDYYEDEYDEEYPDFGNEITLRDANGEVIGSMSKEEWFDLLAHNPAEYLIAEYGMNNIDIIYALEYAGEWDEADWESWSQIYHGIFGD